MPYNANMENKLFDTLSIMNFASFLYVHVTKEAKLRAELHLAKNSNSRENRLFVVPDGGDCVVYSGTMPGTV